MTRKNPYVTGPPLERHSCEDPEPHLQHIARPEPGVEFLCDGKDSQSPLAIARWLATQEYAILVEEVEDVDRDADTEKVSTPIYPGEWDDDGPASNYYLHRMVEWNMTTHAPVDEDVVARFEALREFAKVFSHAVIDLCPPGRDRDLALEHAEDGLMRAVASVARNQDRLEGVLTDDIVSLDEPEGEQFQAPFETSEDLEREAAEALSRPDPDTQDVQDVAEYAEKGTD